MIRNIHTEDVAFICGCSVRHSETKNVTEIRLSKDNYLSFVYDANEYLIIKELLYSGHEELDTLIEATKRIVRYTRSKGITCDNQMPTEITTTLDDTGVLDQIIQ